MGRFGKHKLWILTALISAPLVAVAAGVPNVFAPNTTISSAQMNANFANLADRVTALESARKTKVTVVMDNSAGPLGTTGKTGSFTSTGGPLLVIVSGTGYASENDALLIAVQLDGKSLGTLKGYTNEGSSHKALPTRAFSVPAAAAGTHTVGILAGATNLVTNSGDYFSVTVVEFGD